MKGVFKGSFSTNVPSMSGSVSENRNVPFGNVNAQPHVGIQGPPGPQGASGGYYVPAIEQTGENELEVSFSPSLPDMPAVDPVQVELPHYDVNVDQEQITAAVNEALAEAKASGEFDGADGKDGKDGNDGYTPQKGIDYFDGQPGKDGVDGKDGYTPVKGVDYFDGNPGRDGVDGKDGSDGYTPVRGKDYWTDDDKAEIKSYVDEAILGGAW